MFGLEVEAALPDGVSSDVGGVVVLETVESTGMSAPALGARRAAYSASHSRANGTAASWGSVTSRNRCKYSLAAAEFPSSRWQSAKL